MKGSQGPPKTHPHAHTHTHTRTDSHSEQDLHAGHPSVTVRGRFLYVCAFMLPLYCGPLNFPVTQPGQVRRSSLLIDDGRSCYCFSSANGAITTRIRVAAGVALKPCHCHLELSRLLPKPVVPRLPLSVCEYHELLLSLPPRVQNTPWELAYDTAVDGSSLQNFYRVMEEVAVANKYGIGIFVVTDRADTATRLPIPVAPPPSDTAQDPTASGAPHRKTAHQTVAAPQVSVFGCFTPQVPCLNGYSSRHARQQYYGSTETYVFRIRRTGRNAFRPPSPAASHCTTSPLLPSLVNSVESEVQLLPRASHLNRLQRQGAMENSPDNGTSGGETPPQDSWHTSHGSAAYHSPTTSEAGAQPLRLLQVHRWTGDPSNQNFVFAHLTGFGVGGGDSGPAIYMDSSLQFGTSSKHCETFDNSALHAQSAAHDSVLNHIEFRLLRMVWFTLSPDKRHPFVNMTRNAAVPCDCGRLCRPREFSSLTSSSARPQHFCDDVFYL